MTPDQKDRILRNISFIEKEELFKFIKNNEITFEEMKQTGSLHHLKQNWLKSKIEEIGKEHEEENSFWEDCQYLDNIEKYREYISIYPNGLYVQQAYDIIRNKQEEIDRERNRLINDILNNSESYSAFQIKELIEQGRILKSDLIDSGYMTEDQLHSFMYPPEIREPSREWKDLAPLPNGNTDVYFFGIPSSGKTCVLAGLLNQAQDAQKLRVNIENKLGYDYCYYLIECIENGHVPSQTPNQEDLVNFIDCDITTKQGVHPISLIEMSGEYFVKTYENNTTDGSSTIGAKGYLKNSNDKAIFFVIDYFKGLTRHVSEQRRVLSFVLEKLKVDKILDSTTVIKIILSKCDLMPAEVNKEDYAVEFLRENYGSFIENLKEDIKSYNINKANKNNLHVHAFTLGEFKFGKVFTFDPQSSDELLASVLASTPVKRKKGTFGKLFDEFRK